MEKLKLTDFAKNELKAKEMESVKGKGDGVKCSSGRKCNKNNDSVNLTLANMRAKNPQPSTPNPTPPSKLRDKQP